MGILHLKSLRCASAEKNSLSLVTKNDYAVVKNCVTKNALWA